MKIEKLPSGSYRVRKTIDGKVHSITFDHHPTKKEIDSAVANFYNKNLTIQNAPRKTFIECADKYIEVKRNVLSASTIRAYKSILNNLGDLGEMQMRNIDSVAVQKLINDKSAKCSPKTVKNYASMITAVMDMFYPDLRIKVTLPKPVKNETYIPTSDDIKSILSHSNEKYYIVFMLGCYGLRRSEILALNYPSDFDVKNNLIHINKSMVLNDDGEYIIQNFNKTTESTRDVPVSKDLIKRIGNQGYVYNGYPDKILEYLHTKQKQLGLPKFKFHALRHYFATELDQAGFSSKDIQKLGGWSSDNILKTVYQHNRIEKDRKLQKKAADTILSKLS